MYSLKEFKDIFDPILNEFIDNKLQDFSTKTTDSFIKDFVSYSEKLISHGGKRLRPYIAYLMYKSLGGQNDKEAIKLFVSLEIFHNFCLIHDDIMDKSNTRHGVKTIHEYVTEKLIADKRKGDAVHIGNSQAILIGDLLFSWSIEAFNRNSNFNNENIEKSQDYFYKMIDEVILGQMIDMDLTTRENANENLINEKINLKTARYTFIRPMQIGAFLANPNNKEESFCENLGNKLGLAFQMQDDLLDITGDALIIHKNILRDISDRQQTFFTNYVNTFGSKDQKEKLNKIFGQEVNEKSQNEIQDIFYSSGAIEKGKKYIANAINESKKIVEDGNINRAYKKYFLDLIELIEKRQS